MNTYKVRYTFYTEFEASCDGEAKEIVARNANAIVKNGEFLVKKLKIKMDVYADKENT